MNAALHLTMWILQRRNRLKVIQAALALFMMLFVLGLIFTVATSTEASLPETQDFFVDSNIAEACNTTRKLRAAELFEHGRRRIVVHGFVLDVTRFVPVHPGGNLILMNEVGDDGPVVDSERWFTHYHSPSVVRRFSEFCIGMLAP